MLIINLLIIGLMAFIAWFFFGQSDEPAQAAQDKIRIVVDGGYHPAAIKLLAGKTTTLEFFRKDPSDCVEEVVIPELKIRQFLPLNQVTEIKITPNKPGNIPFHCGMGMVHGKIEVV